MDDDRRKIYDETGDTEEDNIDINDTYEYYRNLYPIITKNDIEDFTIKYKNSEMEVEDLINYYNDNKGDMTNILEWIPLSENLDINRYLKIYEDLFKSKKLKKYKKFTLSKNKIKPINEDTIEKLEKAKEFQDLCKKIKAKKTKREDAFENLSQF